MYKFCTDYERMFENIVASAYTYVAASKVKALVIGMSGGIDSALTAAIASEVVKRLDNNVLLEGRIIDIESNKAELRRGAEAATMFCHEYRYLDLNGSFCILVEDIVGLPIHRGVSYNNLKTRVRMGNIKARLRMIKLYDLAKEHDGMVLSTDNYTEYLLGFWTLHGDVGDFGMIQNLWKTEVYGLSEYLVTKLNKEGRFGQADTLKACINAMPTDGLGITDSDFDQIYPEASKNDTPADVYRMVDTLLYDGIIGRRSEQNEVILRHKATKFKRENPFNIPRKYIVG